MSTLGERIAGDTNITLLLFKLLGQHRDTPEKVPVCAAKLADLTRRDLHTIASGMLFALREEEDEEEATKWFIANYPSMGELSYMYPDFVDTLTTSCSSPPS
ncbi:hypothetical protein TrRE_jg13304 [Triparma retinervis]|uniref:Uncharacterized protein n=1 Tax=Triparma retinervis TaxID=2557542 RepID=A0A9W7E4H0_9STRA|nr:hypothetical protein TrRE_jg13304 [Triparma retinervis]